MGLLSTTNHYHRHEGNTIRFPDTIHEHKAPTDESIRLLEEMNEKVIQSLIAKVDVKDNLVEGKAWAIESRVTAMDDNVGLFFKFKINGREFVVERKVSREELYKAGREIINIQSVLKGYAESVMLWYALKSFVAIAYEQITKQKPPEYLLNQ